MDVIHAHEPQNAHAGRPTLVCWKKINMISKFCVCLVDSFCDMKITSHIAPDFPTPRCIIEIWKTGSFSKDNCCVAWLALCFFFSVPGRAERALCLQGSFAKQAWYFKGVLIPSVCVWVRRHWQLLPRPCRRDTLLLVEFRRSRWLMRYRQFGKRRDIRRECNRIFRQQTQRSIQLNWSYEDETHVKWKCRNSRKWKAIKHNNQKPTIM